MTVPGWANPACRFSHAGIVVLWTGGRDGAAVELLLIRLDGFCDRRAEQAYELS